MADIKVRVGSQNAIKVRVGSQNAFKVVSTLSGTTGTLEGLDDVNIVSPTGGEILVYNAITGKWDSTLTLTPGATQNLVINGGNF
jgi:hypothetical protein